MTDTGGAIDQSTKRCEDGRTDTHEPSIRFAEELDYPSMRSEFGQVLAQLVLDCRAGKRIGLSVDSAYDNLCAVTEGHGPVRLFKYSGVDNAKNAEMRLEDIAAGRLHLSSPSSFNDPYDANPYFDTGTFGAQFDRALHPDGLAECRDQLVKAGVSDRAIDNLSAVLGDESTRKEITECFTDIMVQAVPTGFDGLRARIRIACMCETVRSARMWASYASEGKGFATEYRVVGRETVAAWFSGGRVCGGTGFTLIPVQYAGRLDVTSLAPLFVADGRQVPTVLWEPEYLAWVCSVACKTHEWESEAEWRLACSAPLGVCEQMYALLEPSALYVGWRTEETLVQKLRNIADTKGIGLYRVAPDDASRDGSLALVPVES